MRAVSCLALFVVGLAFAFVFAASAAEPKATKPLTVAVVDAESGQPLTGATVTAGADEDDESVVTMTPEGKAAGL